MANPQDLGRNFEYRVRDWLKKRDWAASRVPVSGIAKNFKNDIHAHHDDFPTRLEIECKKTGKDTIRLFFKDIRKVTYTQDHYGHKLIILVFSIYRSKLFTIVPHYFVQAIFDTYQSEPFQYRGKKSISLGKIELNKIIGRSEHQKYFLQLKDKKEDKTYLIGLLKTILQQVEH